jgi:hypothetical protein
VAAQRFATCEIVAVQVTATIRYDIRLHQRMPLPLEDIIVSVHQLKSSLTLSTKILIDLRPPASSRLFPFVPWLGVPMQFQRIRSLGFGEFGDNDAARPLLSQLIHPGASWRTRLPRRRSGVAQAGSPSW